MVLQAVFAAGEAAMTADYAFTTGSALDPTALPTLFEINSPAIATRVPAMATVGAVVFDGRCFRRQSHRGRDRRRFFETTPGARC